MDIESVAIVVIYLVGLVAIGAWTSRKIKTSEDFLVAGRNLGFWTFVLLVVASICSGMTILGVAGLGYTSGWPSIWEQIFVPLSAAICILIYGTKLHAVASKTGYMTVQDYFAHRFQSPGAIRATSAVIGILISLIYLVGQYVSISIVLSWLFGISYQQALVIGAVIVMGYTILGGLYAIGMASLIQGIMILVGVILVGPAVIQAAGGLEHINMVMASIDPNLVNLSFPQVHPPYAKYAFLTPTYLVSFFFLLAFGLSAAPHVVNNVLAARDQNYFKWAPLAAFVIYVVIMYLTKITGFAARVMVKEGTIVLPTGVSNPPDYSFIVASGHVFPHLFAPIVAVIVLSAVMSTTDRLMLTIGSYVSWDVYKRFLKTDASDKSVTLLSRVAIVASTVLTLIMAWSNPPELLAWLIWMAIGVMLACFVAPLLAGLYWRRATREGALASMILGLVCVTGFSYYARYMGSLPMHPSIYGFAVAVIAMVVVSLITKKTPDKILDETMTGMYIRDRKADAASQREKVLEKTMKT
ncbi:MAG TPA: sodium:solute symporter family protein [Methanotrichaceae archaeon]|nr:sodium:solute symporter family protein [Methanotrichaceae archaeon]